jgi:hypothetical protein
VVVDKEICKVVDADGRSNRVIRKIMLIAIGRIDMELECKSFLPEFQKLHLHGRLRQA